LNTTEAQAARFTDRSKDALQHGAPASLEEAAVDDEGTETWVEAPDMVERNTCKVQTPTHGNAAAAEYGETFVAAVLGAVEAGEREFPDTVY